MSEVYIRIFFSVLVHAGTRKICNSLSILPYLYTSPQHLHLRKYTFYNVQKVLFETILNLFFKNGKLISCIHIGVCNGICFAVRELHVY